MATRFKDPLTWLYGLVAGVIGGAANTVSVMVVDPVAFNFGDVPKLGKVAAVSALVSLAFYLVKSPLPPLETTDTTFTSKSDK